MLQAHARDIPHPLSGLANTNCQCESAPVTLGARVRSESWLRLIERVHGKKKISFVRSERGKPGDLCFDCIVISTAFCTFSA